MERLITIIADDVTGSNDIGLMCLKVGEKANIYDYDEKNIIRNENVIFNTNSRGYGKNKAYEVVRSIENLNSEYVYKKTCSVFRGNIGSEFDAVLDGTSETMHIIVGFPDMGRTTINGIHYLNGTKISKTQFRNDPLNPITTSNLKKIIEKQSKKKVTNIFYDDYKDESRFVKKVDKLEEEFDYIIYDVRDNYDLMFLGTMLKNKKLFGGSSSFVKYLLDNNKRANLILSGSLTEETQEQNEYIKKFIHSFNVTEYDNNKKKIINLLTSGKDVLIYSTREKVKFNVAEKLGIISSQLVSQCNLDSIIVAGGESSGSVAKHLEIKRQKIIDIVDDGVAICKSLDSNFRFVFKSGSFGSEDFYLRAIEKINIWSIYE